MHTLSMFLAQATNNAPAGQDDGSGLVMWAVILLGLALVLFFIEIFLPSGGVIGALSAVCLIGGVVMLFRINTTWGLIGAMVALMALPFAIGFAIRIWPYTPIGRALTLGSPEEDEAEERPKPTAVAGPAVDDEGKAITDLRPVGTCVINGKREECVAIGGTISRGTPVRVADVDGMHIRVRPADRG